jgi:hypothetical protein
MARTTFHPAAPCFRRTAKTASNERNRQETKTSAGNEKEHSNFVVLNATDQDTKQQNVTARTEARTSNVRRAFV